MPSFLSLISEKRLDQFNKSSVDYHFFTGKLMPSCSDLHTLKTQIIFAKNTPLYKLQTNNGSWCLLLWLL